MSKPSQQCMATECTAFLFHQVLTAEFANLETHIPLVFGESCTSGLCWSMGTSNSTHTVWCQAIPYSHSPIFAGSNIHASICRISYLFTPCLTHMNYRSLVNVLRMMLRCVFTHNSLCSTQDQPNQETQWLACLPTWQKSIHLGTKDLVDGPPNMRVLQRGR